MRSSRRVLGVVFAVALMALLAVATRNPAMPLLVVLVWFLVESVVAGMGVWQTANLQLVAGSFPLTSLVALVSGVKDPASYGLAPPPDPPAVLRPLWLSFTVVAGWAAVFIVAAAGLLRRADIRE